MEQSLREKMEASVVKELDERYRYCKQPDGTFRMEIYADYRDEMDGKTAGEICSSKDPVNALWDMKPSQQDDDIMVATLKGGINYWAEEAEVIKEKCVADWVREQIARGGVLMIHDIEDPDEVWELDLEKFLKGFKLWMEKDGGYAICVKENNGNIDANSIDTVNINAVRADAIIQYALFGEVLFS